MRSKPALALAILAAAALSDASTYFLSPSGKDTNSGVSPATAWKTLARAQNQTYLPGDKLLLQGGSTFAGALFVKTPDFTVGSYGTGKATISAGAGTGIFVYDVGGVSLQNLVVEGSWSAAKQSGSTGYGVDAFNDLSGATKLHGLLLYNVEVKGFMQAGIFVGGYPKDGTKSGFTNVTINRCSVHDNGQIGICVYGYFNEAATSYANSDVVIENCVIYQNLGVAAFTSNHTGDGVILSDTLTGVIQNCISHDNGVLNTSTSGPCGIWTFDSCGVTIQYNESYNNHTSSGADGDGFDIDGGSVGCTLQYNYSHGNDGCGYLFAEFPGARAFRNNTIRYNISQNDGRKNSYGGIIVWNGEAGIGNSYIYNNTIYVIPSTNGNPSALGVSTPGVDVLVANNIFQTTEDVALVVLTGPQSGLRLQSNCYWTGNTGTRFYWNGAEYTSLAAWQSATGEEMSGRSSTALFENPMLVAPGLEGTTALAYEPSALGDYRLRSGSPLIGAGLDLKSLHGLNVGATDYFGVPISTPETVGASIYQTPAPQHVVLSAAVHHRLDKTISRFPGLTGEID
jgi:hypothetical protein